MPEESSLPDPLINHPETMKIAGFADTDSINEVPDNLVEVLPRFRRWFLAALAEEANGEQFEWQLSLVQFPTGQQQTNPATGETTTMFISLIAMYVSTPGQVLETSLMQSSQVQLNGHTEEGVRGIVRDIVASLREARRKQPEELRAQMEAMAGNGHRPPGGGLILPG